MALDRVGALNQGHVNDVHKRELLVSWLFLFDNRPLWVSPRSDILQ